MLPPAHSRIVSVDPLAAVMIGGVTGVGFLIHVYAIGYMDEDKDASSCWRFFAYMNLFSSSSQSE